MNYINHYNRLIDRARFRISNSCTETHHIIPRCIGGTDENHNLVELTPEEHYVAHQLLVKMHPDNRKLLHAAIMMCAGSRNNRRNNKIYGWLRKKQSEFISENQKGKGNSQFGRGWICNLTTGEIKRHPLSDNIPDGWIKGKRLHSLCKICGLSTGTRQRVYCDLHRPISEGPGITLTKGSTGAKKLSEYCKSRTKEEHPQYGKRWINNSIVQKMVPLNKVDEYISIGWIRGKIKAPQANLVKACA